jgi:SAM-dependent methyltransferase
MSQSSYWDRALRISDDPNHWLNARAVKRAVQRAVTGHEDLDFFSYLVSRHLHRPARRGLVLGCGRGTAEQHLVMMGACQEVDAIDFSASSIEEASRTASKLGILPSVHYIVADLNEHRLPKQAYDLVVAVGTLHHVVKLERLYLEIERALRPGALIFVDEFVGPNRFQWTDLQIEICNRFLDSAIGNRSGAARVTRPDAAAIAAIDPSESVRSSEVLPLFLERFDLIERHDYGGTLLNPILGQAVVKQLSDPSTETALRLLHALESALIRARVLPSDFVLLVSKGRR